MRTADALHTGRVQIVPDTNLWEQMQMCMRCLVGHLPEGLNRGLGGKSMQPLDIGLATLPSTIHWLHNSFQQIINVYSISYTFSNSDSS
jgi:hypothetical protein